MTEPHIAIVPFSAPHLDGVVSLVLPIQQVEFGVPVTLEAQPDLLDIAGVYQWGKGDFWIALARGEVVGTVGLWDLGDGQGALRKMFVAPAYRGAADGVSLRLLRALLRHARERGVAEIFLGTTEQFLAAHRFYEKNGFARIARTALPARFPVMAVDTRFYVHRIDGRAEGPGNGAGERDAHAPD